MSEKLKNFLRCKIEKMKNAIKCLKVKKLAVQLINGGLITISLGSAAILTVIAPLGVTVIVIRTSFWFGCSFHVDYYET